MFNILNGESEKEQNSMSEEEFRFSSFSMISNPQKYKPHLLLHILLLSNFDHIPADDQSDCLKPAKKRSHI